MASLFWKSISQGHHFDEQKSCRKDFLKPRMTVSNPFDSESAADLSKISLIRACYVDTWKANVHIHPKAKHFCNDFSHQQTIYGSSMVRFSEVVITIS